MRSRTTQRLGRRSAGLVVLGILSLCLLMVGAEAASVVTPQADETTTTTEPPTTTTTTTTTSGSGGAGTPAQPTAPPPTTVTEITLVPADDSDTETDEDDAAEDPGEGAEEPVPAPSAGTFHVSPSAGPPGTEVVFSLRFDLPSSGLETVEIRFGNQRLGDEVAIESSDVTVRRSVPDVEPGTYDLNLAVGELVVARTSFDVTPAPSTENSIPLLVWLAALMLWVVWLIGQARNPTTRIEKPSPNVPDATSPSMIGPSTLDDRQSPPPV
ncbi:hypothetical protein BH23ACT5_BH23ACT5_01410 [soil metagenome]